MCANCSFKLIWISYKHEIIVNIWQVFITNLKKIIYLNVVSDFSLSTHIYTHTHQKKISVCKIYLKTFISRIYFQHLMLSFLFTKVPHILGITANSCENVIFGIGRRRDIFYRFLKCCAAIILYTVSTEIVQ